MKAIIKVMQKGETAEFEVVLPGVDVMDGATKIITAATKVMAGKNTGKPSWDPEAVLLSVRPARSEV